MYGSGQIIFFKILSSLLALLVLCASAEAGIKLRLTYQDQLTAKILTRMVTLNTNSELDFVMNGSTVEVYSVSGGEPKLIGSRSSGEGDYYGPFHFQMIARKDGLDFTADYATHTTRMTIKTDGRSYCRPSISTRLKPGADAFQYELPVYGTVDIYRIYLSGIRCELSTF